VTENKFVAIYIGGLIFILVMWLGAGDLDFSGLWPRAIETMGPLTFGALALLAAIGGAFIVVRIWQGKM